MTLYMRKMKVLKDWLKWL